MKKQGNPNDPGATSGLRLLLCDTTGKACGMSSSDEAWVSSPIQCFDKAVDMNPELIAVRFGQMPVGESGILVELITALKRNSHTRRRPVLALLHSKHRKLLEEIHLAGADFVRYVGETMLDPPRLNQIIDGLNPDDRLAAHLAVLCPFLHYNSMDSRHELIVCGAYLDRMVLGGDRLHQLCETEDHRQCEYFLNPRLNS